MGLLAIRRSVIGYWAFDGCTGLDAVTIPGNVVYQGRVANSPSDGDGERLLPNGIIVTKAHLRQ